MRRDKWLLITFDEVVSDKGIADFAVAWAGDANSRIDMPPDIVKAAQRVVPDVEKGMIPGATIALDKPATVRTKQSYASFRLAGRLDMKDEIIDFLQSEADATTNIDRLRVIDDMIARVKETCHAAR